MKTPCCIENGKICPNTSSCSMILRSACSHGHSHKSVITNEVQAQEDTHKRRKHKDASGDKLSSYTDSCNSTVKFNSFWGSSLKELALTSTQSFSIFKENLYNHLEVSENQTPEFIEKNGHNNYVKQFFNKTSTPIYSCVNEINSHRNFHKEIGVFEKDQGLITPSTMSRTRHLHRHNLRALSGSESEEELNFAKFEKLGNIKKPKNSESVSKTTSSSSLNANSSSNHRKTAKATSSSGVKSGIAAQAISSSSLSKGSTASLNRNSSNASSATPTGNFVCNQRVSPDLQQVDLSVVQYTVIDKFRWLLWKYIYLKIITTVNFDVWLLSRLHDKKYKAILILLLPLLLYILYSTNTHDMEILTKPLDLIQSFITNIYSFFIDLYEFNNKNSHQTKTCQIFHTTLPSLGAFGTFFNFFTKSEETNHLSSKTTSKSFQPVPDKSAHTKPIITSLDTKANKEEMRSVAFEVLKEKFQDLVNNFYDSRVQSDILKMQDDTSKLQMEIWDLKNQFQSLSSLIKQLESSYNMEKSAAAKNIETSSIDQSMQFKLLHEKMNAFEMKLESLGGIKRCCDNKMSPSEFTASIEKYIVTAFKNVIETEENSNSPYRFFSEWLNAKISDPSKLSSEVKSAFETLKTQLKTDTRQDKENLKVIEGIIQHYVESLKRNLSFVSSTGSTYDSLSVNDMRRIAKEAIMLYDADKTGLVDYALESAGGSVLGTRCSESYVEKNGKFSVFGFPLWSDQNSPRTAIQPNVQPGECWAFKGSQGFLVIQLSYTIYPTGFTLEHIPVSLSPTGSIDSAPKNFSVWGLASDVENEGTILGEYSYDHYGEPLQYFPVQNVTTKSFSFVELKILSNHGNQEYTCLYRFRVHGTRVK